MARKQLSFSGGGGMTENFSFGMVGGDERPFLGYVSSVDPTIAAASVIVRGSKNVYKKLSGTLANRSGLKRRGVADTTLAGVTGSYEWGTSWGQERVLRVANSKLQVESNIADGVTYQWYDLLTGLSATRFVFSPWWNNGLKKDQLLFVKGDSNLQRWDGGLGLFLSYAATVITLDRDAATNGFNSGGGSVLINGVSYSYSGISGSTLTGTSDASAAPANSVAVSAVVVTATSPAATFTNDFCQVVGNQLYVGSYTSRLVYVAQGTDYTNFSVPTTRITGDPDLLTLDSCATGIAVQKGDNLKGGAIIAGSTGDWYQFVRSNITVGSTLVEQVDVNKTQSAKLNSPLAHEFIDVVGDSIIFLDQRNQLRQLGFVRNVFTPVYPSLSTDIQTELSEKDATGGHLRAVDDKIYITMPISGDVYIYRISERIDKAGNLLKERVWFAPFVLSASRVAVIGGVEYVHSSQNPQLYQLWDTGQWHDDSPDLASIAAQVPDGTELIVNGTFAGDASGWSLDNWQYAAGAISVINPAVGGTAVQDLPALTQGATYRLTFTVGAGASSMVAGIFAIAGGGGISTLATQTCSAGAGIVTIDFTVGYDVVAYPDLALDFEPNAGFTGTIDDVSLQLLVAGSEVADYTESLAYESIARFGYNWGRPEQGKVTFDKVLVVGYLTQNTTLGGTVYWDYQGSTTTSAIDISSPDNVAPLYSGFLSPSASLGDASVGDNPLGQGTTIALDDQETVPKFRVICGVEEQNVFEYALEVKSGLADDRWELLFIGTNAQSVPELPTELVR